MNKMRIAAILSMAFIGLIACSAKVSASFSSSSEETKNYQKEFKEGFERIHNEAMAKRSGLEGCKFFSLTTEYDSRYGSRSFEVVRCPLSETTLITRKQSIHRRHSSTQVETTTVEQ